MTFEDAAPELLRDFGLSAEKIPELPDGKTPDFIAGCEEYRYLIEVKERFPDPEKLDAREKLLDADKIAEESDPMSYKNSISSIVTDAVTQLNSPFAPDADFRIGWFHCQGYFPETQAQQVVATLYGAATVVDWGSDDGFAGDILYFNESEFFIYRQ